MLMIELRTGHTRLEAGATGHDRAALDSRAHTRIFSNSDNSILYLLTYIHRGERTVTSFL
jgi:hypothetical protein